MAKIDKISEQVDKALAKRLEWVFLQGRSLAEGGYEVAAVKRHHPRFKKEGRRGLVRTREALAGWNRVEPALARLPAPKAAIAPLRSRAGPLRGAGESRQDLRSALRLNGQSGGGLRADGPDP